MRRAAIVDGNQAGIVLALRQIGATVHITSGLGQGYPDLNVGLRGVTYLLEVKRPGEKLTEAEARWHEQWQGHCVIVYSVDDALKAVGAI